MARPIWKGQIAFGLVNVPVTLYSGEDKGGELHFKLLDSRNKSPVRYERVNEMNGQKVPWNEIVKGYEYRKGQYVLINEADFKKASVEATQTVEIEEFVPRSAIDYRFYDKPYLLVPAKKAEKGYVILRETLKRQDKVAISRVVIRSRQYLSALVPEGDGLVLEILRYPDELKDLEDFALPRGNMSEYKVSDKEMDMAAQLVDGMSSKWEPEKYHDEYRDVLMKWIEKKAKEDPESLTEEDEPAPKPPAENVIDITELLRKSVEGRLGAKPGAAKGRVAPSKPGARNKGTRGAPAKPAKNGRKRRVA